MEELDRVVCDKMTFLPTTIMTRFLKTVKGTAGPRTLHLIRKSPDVLKDLKFTLLVSFFHDVIR